MKKYLGIAAVLAVFSLCDKQRGIYAQEKEKLPVYKEILYIENLYAGSQNPSALYFSPIDRVLDINLKYGTDRGDFHHVDRSSKVNQLGIDISGRHRFKQVICYGYISYINQKDFDRRWNSTLFLSPDNPFILGDSIRSDFSTEKFNLTGTVAYSPNNRLIAALQLNYETGSSANQTDPRPRTNGMYFAISPGLNYALTEHISLGVSAEVKLFSESITHLIVDPREGYLYFRFNGMGDFSSISTGVSQTYPRDYDGTEYKGALQFVWNTQKRLSNLFEASYASNSEDARDGGTAFTFLGGDYTRKIFYVKDLFRIKKERYIHNIVLTYANKTVKGIWYEQTQYLDPDKNNQLAYQVQASGLKHKETTSTIDLDYRLDRMKSGKLTLTLFAKGQVTDSKTKHIEGDGYHQEYTKFMANAGASKYFSFGKNHMTVTLEGMGALPLSSSLSAMPRLKEIYTTPVFEYMTGNFFGGHAYFNYQRQFNHFRAGLYADVSLKYYTGDNKYSDVLNNTNYKTFTIGANILF